MPGGGKLLIETRNVDARRGISSRTAPTSAAGDYAVLSRHRHRHRHPAGDAGQGVRAVLHHQGGRQGHRPGLSMVYGFIKQSNGHIAIDSEVGQGHDGQALPAAQRREKEEAGRAAGRRSRAAASASWWSRTMPQVRASVVRQLQSLGYTVFAGAGRHGRPGGLRGGTAALRPAAHRCRHAGAAQRQGTGRRSGAPLAQDESIVHVGLHRGCHHPSRPPRRRGAALSKPFRKTDLATTIREAFDEQGGAGKQSRAVQRAA